MTQIQKGAHALWRFLIAIFAAATVVEVFLAGFGVFRTDPDGQHKKFDTAFDPHGALGFFLQVGALLLLIVALIAWREKRLIGFSALLFVLMVLQTVFAGLGEDHPWVGGLHPINGFIIVGMSGWLASNAWKGRRGMRPRAEPAPSPPA